MSKQEVEKIKARIQEDAQRMISHMNAERDKKLAEIDERTDKELAAQKKQLFEAHEKETERIGKRLHSAARLEAKRGVLQAREEVIEKAFEMLHKSLASLDDARYRAFLKVVISESAKEFGNDIQVLCSAKDMARVKAVASSVSGAIQVSELKKPTIGGVFIESTKTGALINCLFENILERDRSAIREEMGSVLFMKEKEV